jgi:hypothetical protein
MLRASFVSSLASRATSLFRQDQLAKIFMRAFWVKHAKNFCFVADKKLFFSVCVTTIKKPQSHDSRLGYKISARGLLLLAQSAFLLKFNFP